MRDIYSELRSKARELWQEHNLLDEPIHVHARALSTEEAIGNPEADDFPLQQGKEKLMQAEFRGALGQAFTDRYGDFEGTLHEILQMPLENNFRRAVFIATLNAVLRYLNKIDRTIHCRDQEPCECALELAEFIKIYYGTPKIGQIGFQPRMVETLSSLFPLRVLDMDTDRIGTEKFQVTIESPEATDDVIRWADLLLVTGTTITNGTLNFFLNSKPVIFYGTTIAGTAYLMGWNRFCAKSR